jgi:hypothetical protein
MSMRVVRWMAFAAALGFAAACGGQKAQKVVIVEPAEKPVSSLPIYMEAGALGGTSAEVNIGEFARILEQRTVGAEVQGATPGEWVRIRTIFQPREGWLQPQYTRPAPEK